MKSLIENFVDTKVLKAIYGESMPSLESINLHSVDIRRDGPSVLLRFDLRDFPKSPPKKWVDAGFNRVQLRLLAVGVSSLQINGFQSDCMVDLHIAEQKGVFRLSADNGDVKLDVSAEHLMIDGVSAYRD